MVVQQDTDFTVSVACLLYVCCMTNQKEGHFRILTSLNKPLPHLTGASPSRIRVRGVLAGSSWG